MKIKKELLGFVLVMVFVVGMVSGGGIDGRYFNTANNKIVDEDSDGEDNGVIDLAQEHLKLAENLKDYANSMNVEKLNKHISENTERAVNQLSDKQLTSREEFKKTLKDTERWGKVPVDRQPGILKEMAGDKPVDVLNAEGTWKGDTLHLEKYNHDIDLNNKNAVKINSEGLVREITPLGEKFFFKGQEVAGVSPPTKLTPQPPSPTGPGGNGGGGGGGGGGAKLDNAMSQGFDAASKAGSALESLKPKPSPDNAPPSPEGGITPSVATDLYGREEGEEEEEGGPVMRVTRTPEGTNFRFVNNELDLMEQGGVMQVSSVPNADETYAEVNAINGELSELELTNTVTRVSNPEPIADVYTPSETTPLSLNPSSGEPAIANSLITGEVTGDISSNQFVKLINYDLAFGGKRILVDVFKSFEKVSGDGEKLYVKNGGMYLKFNGKKIFYSRRIKGSPHSLGEISNVKDRDNKFSLIEYAENKGRLKDMRGRVSVGDNSIVHPRDGRLKVAGVREKMWVKR